ncbi:4-oxalocrotonate tautomerase [Embleya sp. NPDC005971]|uniref:4-oxalocrotonate tautomerase n=1 Tax=Embleya sp. NPDC005971 TaxID=3156724 RepID=UPI0033C83E3E
MPGSRHCPVPGDRRPRNRRRPRGDRLLYGERARTSVGLIDEVVDGGWGVAGTVLTATMLNGKA